MKVETVPVDSLKAITFSLINEINKKKENYAVPIEQVREIRDFLEITTVPKSKQYVKGIMNLRGLIIPVIDIKKRLGFGEADIQNKKNYKIIIADVRDSIYGLIVDKVEQVLNIPINDIEPVPADSFGSYHYIKGIAKINEKLIVLLDIIALLEESEENYKESENITDSYISNFDNSNIKKNDKINLEINHNQPIDDDIPEELKEVFREDQKKISSKGGPK
ncbi:MAG TPA: chemotaxis protein CheW [Nitrosopumilaceae archaeon]|nr:chemotaxis protein CheW [Nitrosopumilaceae archaeon]